MSKLKELLKAFIAVAVFLAILLLCVWGAASLDAYWILFILIPIIVLIAFTMFVHSITGMKCKHCGKEMGVRTGGLISIWATEKPKKCQWCDHVPV